MSYDAIIEADSDRDGFLLIATDWGSGTFNNEFNEFLRFSQGDTTHLVELDDTSWFKGLSRVIELGTEHIRIGTDHILFVLALVLPSVLVFVKWRDEEQRWHPEPSFGASLWRVLKIVTMFTVAHSITLALGGLGIVELSPRLVETIIALSIAAAALHNIRPIFVNKEWCWRSPSASSTGSVSPVCCRSWGWIAASGSRPSSASTSGRAGSGRHHPDGVPHALHPAPDALLPADDVRRFGGSGGHGVGDRTDLRLRHPGQRAGGSGPSVAPVRSAGGRRLRHRRGPWWFDRSRGRLEPVDDLGVEIDLDEPPERELVNA